MNSFASWLDKPFRPGRISGPRRRATRVVTIRYSGSVARAAGKTLVVILFLAFLSGVMSERPGRDLDANEVAYRAVRAAIPR